LDLWLEAAVVAAVLALPVAPVGSAALAAAVLRLVRRRPAPSSVRGDSKVTLPANIFVIKKIMYLHDHPYYG
jgi:hypothetical protein